MVAGLFRADGVRPNCGDVVEGDADPILNNNLMQTKFDDMGMEDAADNTSKNVGKLTRFNAEPVAFNHLSGHFTEALVGGGMSTTDQTASWGGTPVIRPAVNNNNNMGMRADYSTLNGTDRPMPMRVWAAVWRRRTPVAWRRSSITLSRGLD